MKITREEEISNEKNHEAGPWTDHKHYHMLTVQLINRGTEIRIHKRLYFLSGATGYGIDKITKIDYLGAAFLTHDIEKLTPEIEKKLVESITQQIDERNEKIKETIQSELNRIELNKELKKEILNSEYFREDKLKRILK